MLTREKELTEETIGEDQTDMRGVRYEEDGVASAVGAILAILIFIFLLSLFVTSYVPAEMTSYEEQYSSALTNEIMQFSSSMNLLSLNYQQGETMSVTFDLQSGYVPLFSSPTTGELSLSASSNGSAGYIAISNSRSTVTAGGVLTVLTNNRYFVDEALIYELSNTYYEQYGSSPLINSTLAFNLLQINPPTNGSINLSMNLVNMMGGPLSISSQSPFSLTTTALSKETYQLNGNITLTYSSIIGSELYDSLQEKMANLKGVTLSYYIEGNGNDRISIGSSSAQLSLSITVLTVMVDVNGS